MSLLDSMFAGEQRELYIIIIWEHKALITKMEFVCKYFVLFQDLKIITSCLEW